MFADPSLPKAYYYPSPPKSISSKMRKTYVSPDRHVIGKTNNGIYKSPSIEDFLSKGHTLSSKGMETSPEAGSSKFNESWASTERPSSVGSNYKDVSPQSIPEKETSFRTSTRLDRYSRSYEEKKPEESRESTLQKYIDRFRNAPPTSREERSQKQRAKDPKKDFWWLNSSALSSIKAPVFTPTKTPTKVGGKMKHKVSKSPPSPYNYRTNGQDLQKSPTGHEVKRTLPLIDEATLELQRKADALIEMSESNVSSEPAVSTEGLGSSFSSNNTQISVPEIPRRPEFTKIHVPVTDPVNQVKSQEISAKADEILLHKQSPVKNSDDILQVWRRRRRIELAKASRPMTQPILPQSPQKGEKNPQIEKLLSDFRERLMSGTGTGNAPHHPAKHIEFTPSPAKPSTSFREVPQHDVSMSEDQENKNTRPTSAPIASPKLKRAKDTGIEPHYHLMCDLLPCPHQNEAGDLKNNSFMSDRPEKDSGNDLEKLQPERESDGVSDVSDSNENFDKCNVPLDSDKNEQSVTHMPLERGENETKERSESNTGNEAQFWTMLRERKKDNLVKEQEKSETSCESVKYEKKTVSKDDKSTEKISKKEKKSKKGKSKKKRDTEHVASCDSNENADKAKKDTVVDSCESQPSASPTKTVTSTIGQVISSRLFESPESRFQSSIESVGSVSQSRVDTGEGSSSSDADEFQDDEILQMLKKQRKFYETQLRSVDKLLLSCESRPQQNSGPDKIYDQS